MRRREATAENLGKVRAYLVAWCLRKRVRVEDVGGPRTSPCVEVRRHFFADAIEAGHSPTAIGEVVGFDPSGVSKGAKAWREKAGGMDAERALREERGA